nr:MFS transporter [Actinomadura craniellae]
MLYPVYAVLFAETGLSAAEISSLFILWSLTGFVVEVPSGLLADVVSRRLLVVLAPLLAGAGFALWTFLPGYPAFAAGFVLWGVGGSVQSGALEALVYEELSRAGAAGSYARLTGRAEAVGITAVMAASGLAAPVLALGGYRALGVASIAATLVAAAIALSFPEQGRAAGGEPDEPEQGYAAVLRAGLAEVRGSPRVRSAVIMVAALSGFTTLDEYIPLLAGATVTAPAAVPLLVLLVSAGAAAGGWLAGRGTHRTGPALVVAAGCLAAGSLAARPAGLVLVAVAFGVFQWAMAAADAALQDRITDQARATVTSMSGLGVEVVAVTAYAGYGLGSLWAGPGPLFALAAVPYLLLGAALWRQR